MATLPEIRQQYPQYNDLSDQQLADSMYSKHYSDMPRQEFDAKIGFSNQQQAGNPQPQGEQLAPANANNLGDNQNDLLHSISAWANSPTTVDTSDLPQSGQGLNFSQKLGFGAQALGRGAVGAGEDMVVKPMARGLTELLQGAAGEMRPATDNPLDPQRGNLSSDALSSLGLLSPSSVAMQSKMAPFNSGQQMPEPVGNQLIKFGNNLKPGAMGDAEDAALNQVMRPSPGKQPGSSLFAGFKARKPEELTEASSVQKSSAGNLYKQMRDVGAVLNQDTANNLSSSIDDALKQNLFIPQLNPKTLGIVEHLKETIDKNGSLGLDELDQYRRLLSRVGNTEDGVSAGSVRQAIDAAVNNLTDKDLSAGTTEAVDLLNSGRSAYSSASKFEAVSDVIAKANGDPNKIKQGLTNFLKNDKNLRGFNDDQIAAIRYAANTGIGENVLKAFGKFGLDFAPTGTGNTVLPFLASFGKAGGASLVPGGLPAVAAATIMRQGQKYIARGKAEQLLKFLEGAQ